MENKNDRPNKSKYEHMHMHDHDHDQIFDRLGASASIARDLALLEYMLNDNVRHTRELAEIGERLKGAGFPEVSGQILEAVGFFEKGNKKIEEALAQTRKDKEGE